MKFGQSLRKEWRSSKELESAYNPLARQLNRLLILDHVWKQLVGSKTRFWMLKAVKGDTLYVQVKAAVAKNELIARRQQLINELNKHFEKPWISKIEIQA